MGRGLEIAAAFGHDVHLVAVASGPGVRNSPASADFTQVRGERLQHYVYESILGTYEHELPEGAGSSASGQRG